jgi:LuxR family maltose regulon positive regulatory protein
MPKSGTPIVRNELLHADASRVQVGSLQWYEWLSSHKKFTFEGEGGHFIAQCETRRDKAYWYAYRRRGGKLIKVYLGKSEELTPERLQQASLSLAGQTRFDQPTSSPLETRLPISETRIDTSFLPMAKVNVPVLPQKLITRSRLTRQITTPLTLLYAPSGFGKSTLLNTWKQTCGFPVAWLTLDENDNHPLRFWHSLVMALQTICPDLGRELIPFLRVSTAAQLPDIVSRLTNNLACLGEPGARFGLVLDDFHRVHSNEVYTSLQMWLEQFPPSLQLVISGHIKPPLALGHLRARGMLLELDADDLRFTLEEGVNYLLQYPQNPPLARDDLERLVKHTEGWAAGLTLTALALGKQGDRRHFIDTFSGAHIYLREYFMETVLQHSTPEVQTFLLKTAILKQLTGSLCDALTGQTDGEEILSRLWHENLFVVRLEEQGWYRYHDLFAEMLYSQLQARFPAEVPLLHQRAAQWYREQYAPADAIYHLLAIQSWEEAASLMEEMALRELEEYGEDSRLLRWLQELPESVVQQHKTLLFVYLRLAVSALPRKKIETFISRIEANIIHKSVSRQTPDEKDVLVEIQQIRHLWSQGNTFTPPPTAGGEHDARWELLDGLRLLGSNEQSVENFNTQIAYLYETAQAHRNLFVILMAGGTRARRVFTNGQLKRSEKIAQQVLQQAMVQRGKLPEPASISLVALSRIHFERNELDMAERVLQRAAEVDPNPTSSNMTVQLAILRAELQSAQGKGEEARATLQAARELHARRPSGIWSDQDLLAYEAMTWLRDGERAAAEQLMSQGSEPGTHALSDLVYAEIALLGKEFDVAETLLQRLLTEYPDGLPYEPLLPGRIMLALALFGQHKVNQSRQVMADAIRSAAPERFIRPFLDYGPLSIPLLTLVLQTENLTAEAQTFIGKILQLSGSFVETTDVPTPELRALSTAASISVREQEVLQFMSAGLSNGEIAGKLSISESTVKTHLANIYYKLGVNRRVQAIAQAKELKLIR